MPLRDVQLSDEPPAILIDRVRETRRELIAAYERIDELQSGLKGLIGFVQLLSHNRDIPKSVRDDMLLNHRVIDAEELLR